MLRHRTEGSREQSRRRMQTRFRQNVHQAAAAPQEASIYALQAFVEVDRILVVVRQAPEAPLGTLGHIAIVMSAGAAAVRAGGRHRRRRPAHGAHGAAKRDGARGAGVRIHERLD